jgi:hypothetical protein
MSRVMMFAVAAALLVSVPAAAHHRPGHTGGPGESGRLTGLANPFTLTFGAGTVVSGRLTGQNNGGRRVTLAEDPFPYGGGYTDVATTTTAGNGSYAFPRRFPPTNRNYRVSVGADQTFTGARVRLRVSFSLGDSTPRVGQRVGFTGFVAPKHDGRTVLVQRRTATGAWRIVKRTLLRATTGDRSRYSTSLVIRRSGTYRTRVAGDGDHLTGTSRTRTARVG